VWQKEQHKSTDAKAIPLNYNEIDNESLEDFAQKVSSIMTMQCNGIHTKTLNNDPESAFLPSYGLSVRVKFFEVVLFEFELPHNVFCIFEAIAQFCIM